MSTKDFRGHHVFDFDLGRKQAIFHTAVIKSKQLLKMQSSVTGYVVKFILLVLFLMLDLIMNVVLEVPNRFEEIDTTSNSNAAYSISKTHILQCSVQLISHLCSFTIMFSMFTMTIPFELGLLSTLLSRFKVWFVLCIFYFFLTICLCSVRLVSILFRQVHEYIE
jgi:hypothetical protein